MTSSFSYIYSLPSTTYISIPQSTYPNISLMQLTRCQTPMLINLPSVSSLHRHDLPLS